MPINVYYLLLLNEGSYLCFGDVRYFGSEAVGGKSDGVSDLPQFLLGVVFALPLARHYICT